MGLGTTHPGAILREELEARGMSAASLAHKLHISPQRIQDVIRGQRAITPETALRLSRYFGNEAEFWMNLQMNFELAETRRTRGAKIWAEVEQAA